MQPRYKILVTGASGLLGRGIVRQLGLLANCEVLGTAHTRVREGLHRLNLLDPAELESLLKSYRPDFIIHAAAERRPEAVEKHPDQTRNLNVIATQRLAEQAKKIGAFVIYISTDYVFDGENPPHSPQSKTNPLNEYGKSKLEGETVLWGTTDNASVLRLPILYGPIEFLEESSVTALAQLVLSNEEVLIDDWAIRYPAHVDDVGIVCRQMLQKKMADLHFRGTFHWSGKEPFTKYQIAQVMGKILGKTTEHITPVTIAPAGISKPHNAQLDCSALENLGMGHHTDFRSALNNIIVAALAKTQAERSAT